LLDPQHLVARATPGVRVRVARGIGREEAQVDAVREMLADQGRIVVAVVGAVENEAHVAHGLPRKRTHSKRTRIVLTHSARDSYHPCGRIRREAGTEEAVTIVRRDETVHAAHTMAFEESTTDTKAQDAVRRTGRGREAASDHGVPGAVPP